MITKWQYRYGDDKRLTVTVKAPNREVAFLKALRTLDRRADKRGEEAPVRWNLRLIKTS